MPRSWFDFGNVESLISGKQINNIELLQVLTGITLLDNLGQTKYYDFFTNGFGGWSTASSGAGTAPYLYDLGLVSAELPYHTGLNVLMNPGVVANDLSYFSKSVFLGKQTKVGLEVGYKMYANSPNLYIRKQYNPENYPAKEMNILVKHDTSELYVLSQSGNYVVYNFQKPVGITGVNTQIKVVGDYETGFYRKLLFNDNVFDVSAYDMLNLVGVPEGHCGEQLQAKSYGAGTGQIIVGYVRSTVDEP